jgi:HD-GYP domain-containing protein (c-di-GMP phosphodiesterase class II)/DNA-binding CsgD family transcriptional regulator
VPLAEVMATLGLAIDVAMGQPIGQGLGTCLLAVRLAGLLGFDEPLLVRVYDLALLRHSGCTAYAREAFAFLGDEVAFRSQVARLDMANPTEMVPFMLRHLVRTHPPRQLAAVIARVAAAGGASFREATAGACEVAQMLSGRLGLNEETRADLGQVYERWDGKGLPGRIAGERLRLPVRVVQVAEVADLYRRIGDEDAAVAVVRRRAGRALDPQIADRFCHQPRELLAGMDSETLWDDVQAAEPTPARVLTSGRLEDSLVAMAEFADLKSPVTLGHSTGVAELVAGAAERCGLPPADVATLRRAALLHDLGRVSVPAAVWTKPGPLSPGEWEQVRLHPYYTERVVARSPFLAGPGRLASRHHERLDGSGYHRSVAAGQLSMPERLLAAADAYQAMTQRRAHRPALEPSAAARVLRDEVRLGRLCGRAVDAVLAAAGQHVGQRVTRWVAGLTDREVEVLRLVARGLPTRQVAQALTISARTADHHIESIYAKTGVSTRAAVTLFAVQHGLVAER